MSEQESEQKKMHENMHAFHPYTGASELSTNVPQGSHQSTEQDDSAGRVRSSTVPSQWATSFMPGVAAGVPTDNTQNRGMIATTGPFGASTRQAFESVGKREALDPVEAQFSALNIQSSPSPYGPVSMNTPAHRQADKTFYPPSYNPVHGMHGMHPNPSYSASQQRYPTQQTASSQQTTSYFPQTPAQYPQYQQYPAQQYQHSVSPEQTFPTQQYQGYQAPVGQSSSSMIKVPSEYSIFVGQLGPEVDESMLWRTFGPRYQSFIKANLMRHKETGDSRGFAFVRFIDPLERDHALNNMNGVFVGNSKMVVGRANKELSKGQFADVPGGYAAMSSYPLAPAQSTPAYPGYAGQGNVKHETQWATSQEQRPSEPMYANPMAPQYDTKANTGQAQSYFAYQQPFATSQVNIVDPANITVFVGGLPIGSNAEQLTDLFKTCGEIIHVNIPAGKGCGFIKFQTHQQALATIQNMQGVELNGARLRLSWGKHAR